MTTCKAFCISVLCSFTLISSHASHAAEAASGAKKADTPPAQNLAFEEIELDSLDTTGVFSRKPVKIKGYLLKARGAGKSPGAVLVPACNGLLSGDGKNIRINYRKMARHLNGLGMTVLLIDGFNPRGFTEICTQSGKSRSIDTLVRLKDSFGGLLYLRSRDDMITDKVFLVSWGATGSFQAMNKGSPYVEKAGAGFTAAIMFYPECDRVDGQFAPYAPIQMFVGEKDSWNPASACRELAKRQESGSAVFNIKTYPDTYHAFDSPAPPKLRTDAAVGPVMVGGNPESAEDAYKATAAFLESFAGKQ